MISSCQVFSWADADRIRDAIETDARPLPEAPLPRLNLPVKFEKQVSWTKQLSATNTASRNWHRRKNQRLQAAGLNQRGKPYKNERRTRTLVHPDLPPKLYLNHAAYMAAWRAKKKREK